MASSIAEQLSQVPLLSTVLRTDFDLLEASPSFIDASILLQGWIEKKLRPFTSDKIDWSKPYDRLSLNETLFEFTQTPDIFTFTLLHPDSKQRHLREWITEVCLNAETGRPRIASRLSVKQPRYSQEPPSRAPGFLVDLVRRIGASDTIMLQAEPREIFGADVDELTELLLSKQRTLPVLAISLDTETGVPLVDSNELAGHLAGVAHVVVLDPVASWTITQKFGKERSTFRGAVRCYNSGFTGLDDPFIHRLWLRESILRSDAFSTKGFLNLCLNHMFATSTAQFAAYPILTPPAVRRRIQDSPLVPVSLVEEAMPQQVSEAPTPIAELLSDTTAALTWEAERTAFHASIAQFMNELKEKELEIKDLEKQLNDARDETAQKNQDLIRLRPFEQEAKDLREDLLILKGNYQTQDAPILRDFWDGFNMFFESAKNVAAQFKTMESLEAFNNELVSEVGSKEQEIHNLRGKLLSTQSHVQALSTNSPVQSNMVIYPETWSQFCQAERTMRSRLLISDRIEETLRAHPFSESLAKTVNRLLDTLEQMAIQTGSDGKLTDEGLQLLQQYFAGENAAFSDESDTNKREFAKDLRFPDPEDYSKRLFCPWHGKIGNQSFRIHFEWPIPEGQRCMKVVYIGPKITKH